MKKIAEAVEELVVCFYQVRLKTTNDEVFISHIFMPLNP